MYWYNFPTELKKKLHITNLDCCDFVEEFNKKVEGITWSPLPKKLNELVEILNSADCYDGDKLDVEEFYYYNLPEKVEVLVEFVKNLNCPVINPS